MANVDYINQHSPSFLILLGDSYRLPLKDHVESFKRAIIESIESPIYSVIGNHESIDREIYSSIFKNTYFSFSHCNNTYIFLDSEESDDSHFSDNQLDFLLNIGGSIGDSKNVFIFSHKLLWASKTNKYSPVWNSMNVRGKDADYDYYVDTIKPIIYKISEKYPTDRKSVV